MVALIRVIVMEINGWSGNFLFKFPFKLTIIEDVQQYVHNNFNLWI